MQHPERENARTSITLEDLAAVGRSITSAADRARQRGGDTEWTDNQRKQIAEALSLAVETYGAIPEEPANRRYGK